MIYRVWHRTTYDYEDPVSVSHHLVRLTPRNLPGQVCRETGLTILPAPAGHRQSQRLFRQYPNVFHAAGTARQPDRGGQQRTGSAEHPTAGFFRIATVGDGCGVGGHGP